MKENDREADIIKENLQPGKYIACTYDEHWFVGSVLEENIDVLVKFMKRNKENLTWPNVICIISAPDASGRSGRQYILSENDHKKIINLLPKNVRS
ncbi:hypothetical protein SNE40_014328 [Patella caerulea]|uniref:Uncharacterized protein n=1 Tax=Patella caerulea TaxID=87958 RepID=A0AAN8JHZ8_PATCE